MSDNKTISVWLKLEDGDHKDSIVLQKRSSKNDIVLFNDQYEVLKNIIKKYL